MGKNPFDVCSVFGVDVSSSEGGSSNMNFLPSSNFLVEVSNGSSPGLHSPFGWFSFNDNSDPGVVVSSLDDGVNSSVSESGEGLSDDDPSLVSLNSDQLFDDLGLLSVASDVVDSVNSPLSTNSLDDDHTVFDSSSLSDNSPFVFSTNVVSSVNKFPLFTSSSNKSSLVVDGDSVGLSVSFVVSVINSVPVSS